MLVPKTTEDLVSTPEAAITLQLFRAGMCTYKRGEGETVRMIIVELLRFKSSISSNIYFDVRVFKGPSRCQL